MAFLDLKKNNNSISGLSKEIIDHNALGWEILFNVKEGKERISFVYYGNSCDKFAQ